MKPSSSSSSSSSSSLLFLLILLLLLTSTIPRASAAKSPSSSSNKHSKILLSTVRSLTLRASEKTTHRRVPPVPQLTCAGPPELCKLRGATPSAMRCTNAGSSYDGAEDVEWTCTAQMPPELKLGATDVVCEGWDGPQDQWVLKGSCGVRYTLALTEMGEERFPHLLSGSRNAAGGGGRGGGGRGWFSGWGVHDYDEGESSAEYDEYYGKSGKEVEGNAWAASLFWIVFAAVLLWILWSAYGRRATGTGTGPGTRRRPGGGGGGGGGPGWGGGGGGGGGWGGGGGGGGYNDPPPPYSPYPSSGKPSSSSRTSNPRNSGNGWQPGFWTGALGGAAAGYFMGGGGGGGNNNRNQQQQQRQRPLGGGGGGGGFWGGSSAASGSGSGSGARTSTSTSRYASTGFGSTSRR